MVPRLPHTRNISGNAIVSPSIRQQPQMGLTAYLRISRGSFPSHLSGNTSAKCGYHWTHGVLLTPGLRLTGAGTSETQRHSATRQGDHPRGPASEIFQGGVRGGVPPHVQSTSHPRVMDPDERIVKGRRGPPPTPHQSVHCHHDGGAGRSVPEFPTDRTSDTCGGETVPHGRLHPIGQRYCMGGMQAFPEPDRWE